MTKNERDSIRTFLCICLFLAILFGVLSLCFLHTVKEGNAYYTKEDVSLYVYKFKSLPKNFLTKAAVSQMTAAELRGYNVGGNAFNNLEGLIDNPQRLPMVECDIYNGRCDALNRGKERLVFFADGSAVFYTADHYESFTLMTMAKINGLSYLFLALFALCVVIYILTLLFGCRNRKESRLAYLELSFEIVIVSLLFAALSPLALVVWIVESIADKIADSRTKKEMSAK